MPENQTPLKKENNKSVRLYKKKRFILPVLFLLIAAVLVAVYWFMFLRNYVSTDDAYVDANQLDVSTKILGRITELNLSEGDTVKEGKLLVQLDDSDLKAQEQQEMANISEDEHNVTLAQVALELAGNDYRRTTELYKDSVVTWDKFDRTEKAYRMAQAQVEIARARVKTAKAKLNVLQTQLENTKIFSPMTGVIAKKWVSLGEVVQPGQPIYTVYDLKNVWVTANFEETKLASIHLDDPVEISVDTYSGMKFEGRVFLIGAVTAAQFSLIPPNNASGNYTKVTQRIPVKISIQQKPGSPGSDPFVLLPGMSVEVKVRVRGD